MAFDEKAAQRLRVVLEKYDAVTERKMMGGLVFMVRGHMTCAIHGDSLMVRVGPDAREAALKRAHVGPLDIGGGRTPSAFVCVRPEGFSGKRAIGAWVRRALNFVDTLPDK